MARMRSLKPEFWDDEELATVLSRDARMLYMGLWNQADEHARCRGDARWVKGKVFAYDDDLTPSAVEALLNELAAAGKVVRYRVDGGSFLHLPTLAKHQRLEPDKTPSRLPEPPDPENFPDKSGKNPESGERDNDSSVVDVDSGSAQVAPDAGNGANNSGNFPDESALARARSFKHVAGSMEQVAGSRVEVPASAQTSTRPPVARFDELWAVYPLQDGETEARKAWVDAIKRDTPDAIIAGALRYRDWSQRSALHTKRLVNWLKNDCWKDTLLAAVPPPQSSRAAPEQRQSTTDQRVNAALALAAKFDNLGPAAITGGLA